MSQKRSIDTAGREVPVIIVGAGIAGLTVAKTLADNGVNCIVLEKQSSLGGHVSKWACMATDKCLRCFCCIIEDLINHARSATRIDILEGWELSHVSKLNNNSLRIGIKRTHNGSEQLLSASSLVLANGFQPYDPSEKFFWGYGRLDGVYTLAELNALIREDRLMVFAPDTGDMRIAFFQCIGSRDKSIGANYCSQFCCKAALRAALKLANDRPKIEITLFYIDLQLAGKYASSLLTQASQQNIRLIQGVPGEIVQSQDGLLEIIREQDGINIKESYHKIILSIGQRPSAANKSFASTIGLSTDEFGFFSPRDFMDNSRTTVQGVYIAGTCCGPKDIEETLEHAGQTAAAVISDLQRREEGI